MKIDGKARLQAKIAAMPVKTRDRIRKSLESSARDMADVAKRLAPVKSGALRNSIGYTFGSYSPENANVRGVSSSGGGHDLSVTVHAGDATAWYASLVEFGTVPHVIKPKKPGGLLNVHGRMIAEVHHPGATARPYFFPAYRLTKKQLKARVRAAVSRAAKEAASG